MAELDDLFAAAGESIKGGIESYKGPSGGLRGKVFSHLDVVRKEHKGKSVRMAALVRSCFTDKAIQTSLKELDAKTGITKNEARQRINNYVGHWLDGRKLKKHGPKGQITVTL